MADQIAGELPAGRAYLADQLRRAASSIPLNIAEGAGEFSRKDKARFYRMARRSATESAAVLDVARKLDLAKSESIGLGRQQLLRIVSMLIAMCRTLRPSTGAGAGTGTERAQAPLDR